MRTKGIPLICVLSIVAVALAAERVHDLEVVHGKVSGKLTSNDLPPPKGLRDVGDFLAAMMPRIAKGWELTSVTYGRVLPVDRPTGRGFHLLIYDTKAPVAPGRRAPWTDVHIWVMDQDYKAKGPFRYGRHPIEEIAPWRGRRVFLGGGKQRWPRWRDEVVAALKAAGAGKPRGRAAEIQQWFKAVAGFVETLGPKVHADWHCPQFSYSRHRLASSFGPGQGWGFRLSFRQRTRNGKKIGPDASYSGAILWLMDPSFKGQLPKKTEYEFVPDELGRWHGGRTFVRGYSVGGEGDWPGWRKAVTAALGATEAAVKPATTQPSTASLRVEIDARQPADAPVILKTRLTNTSGKDMHDDFESPLLFRAFLKGSGGQTRRVCVTNGAQIEGSFATPPALKPGKTVATPLRLTRYTGADWRRYLPSEHVYLPPGKYRLRLDRIFPGPDRGGQVMATAAVQFTVVREADLAKARFAELRAPAKGLERFAEHVLKATLTPEIRRQWYRDIKDPDPKKARWKLYTLCSFVDPPPDVMPAVVAALKVHVNNSDVTDRDLHGLLNNAAGAMLSHHPPGAGPALLKLATGAFHPSDRGMAIETLRHYYHGEMANRIADLLKDENKWISLCAARLLAWAGDDRGVDVLIAGVKAKNATAAAALSYFTTHTAAAEAVQEALTSKDREFVKRVRKALGTQPMRRPRPGSASASWGDVVEGLQCGISLNEGVYTTEEEPRVTIALRNVSKENIASVLPSADPGSDFPALVTFTFRRRSQGRWSQHTAGVRLKLAKRARPNPNPGSNEYAVAAKNKVFRAAFSLRSLVTNLGKALKLEPGDYSVSVTYFIRASTPKYAKPRPQGATLWAGHHLRSGEAWFRVTAAAGKLRRPEPGAAAPDELRRAQLPALPALGARVPAARRLRASLGTQLRGPQEGPQAPGHGDDEVHGRSGQSPGGGKLSRVLADTSLRLNTGTL